MAGISWIKIETTFPRKPVVFVVASRLNMEPNTVIGALVSLLCWADGVAEDGCLGFCDPSFVDHVTACSGLGAALMDAGWLMKGDGDKLYLNNWDIHNGECAKKRAMRARRNEKYYDKSKTQASLNNALNQDAPASENKTAARPLDKIRIDNKKEPYGSSKEEVRETVSAPDNSGDTFVITKGEASYRIPKDRGNDRFLDAYGKQPKVVRAFQIEWASALEREDPELLIACAQICRDQMTDDDYRFQLAPENWLADRRYDQFRRAAKQTVTHNRTTSYVLAPLPGEE